ncbi:hypothetical protein ACMBCN_00685, partial [Candidatus Liberibacter asiaticus]
MEEAGHNKGKCLAQIRPMLNFLLERLPKMELPHLVIKEIMESDESRSSREKNNAHINHCARSIVSLL